MKLLGIAGSLRGGFVQPPAPAACCGQPPGRRRATPSGRGSAICRRSTRTRRTRPSFAVGGVPLGRRGRRRRPDRDARVQRLDPRCAQERARLGSRPRDTAAFRGKPVAAIGASTGSFGGVWAPRRDTQDPRPDGGTRRRGGALGRQGERAARPSRTRSWSVSSVPSSTCSSAKHPRAPWPLRARSYIRKTPNVVSGTGAFAAAARPSASTRRVSSGSMIPSSQSRAVEKYGEPSRS